MCECGSEQVALEGSFGAWEDVGWCGWVLGVSGGLMESFPTLGLQKKAYKKNYRRTQGKLQEENRETTRGLQEEVERNFHCF